MMGVLLVRCGGVVEDPSLLASGRTTLAGWLPQAS